MTMWLVRIVRGTFLVALVLALAISADQLLGSTREAATTASRPITAINEAADDVAGVGPIVVAEPVADLPATDEPTELPTDAIDLGQPAEIVADTTSQSSTLVDAVDPASLTLAPMSSSAGAKGQYQKTEVAKLSYGSDAQALGLVTSSSHRPVGPASFTVDRTGAVYVSDNVNGRIQVYSAQGKHQRSLKAEADVFDLVAGDEGDLYLMGSDGAVVAQDAATGKTKAKWTVTGPAAQELGRLRVADGQLSVETPRQMSYPVAVAQGQAMSALSAKDQENSQKKGAKTQSKDYYSTSYRDGGHLFRLDDTGKTIQDIALGLTDVATVVFLGEDRVGNLYVQVERVSGSDQVSVEVRQFAKKGELTAVVPLDRVDYLPMTRSAIVTEDGAIYQLVATKQGAALVKWQRS